MSAAPLALGDLKLGYGATRIASATTWSMWAASMRPGQ
jgi:hypothetical protein